jgi:type I restriction enzyme S subunit
MTVAEGQAWRSFVLGEFLRVKHGYAFKGEHFSDSGPYIVLTPGNFYDEGGFKHKENEKYYTGDFPSDFLLKRGDLLVVMTEQKVGLLGSPAIVPEADVYLHNQRLGLIVDLDADLAHRKFLYYLFNFRGVRDQIQATANGAKVRHTSPSRIYEVEVRLPSLEAQCMIASILSAYDDLIENNLRRIKILEEMAQALYREWFVKFRFPGHEKVRMVESSLGEIPEGWAIRRLVDACVLVMGQSPKSEFYNERGEGLPFHQGVTGFGHRFPEHRVFCTVENRIAKAGDVLFSVRAPVGRINLANTRMVLGRGLAAIRNRSGNQWFTFRQIKGRFKEEDTMGGGTIFKAVTKKDMEDVEFLMPASSMVDLFEALSTPMEAEIENLTNRSSILRRTRDLLLPKLISGDLDVSNLDIPIPEDAA